ncbi:MAG: endonuclease domain-containing protein [Bacteroidota bacterium]
MSRHFLKYPKSSIPKARRLRREMTDSERKLWSLLRRKQLGVRFRKQVPFGPYILDFLSIKAKVVIEVDGSPHDEDASLVRDAKRDAFLRSKGLRVLRFSSKDILNRTLGVWQTILDNVERQSERFTSPPSGGE